MRPDSWGEARFQGIDKSKERDLSLYGLSLVLSLHILCAAPSNALPVVHRQKARCLQIGRATAYNWSIASGPSKSTPKFISEFEANLAHRPLLSVQAFVSCLPGDSILHW